MPKQISQIRSAGTVAVQCAGDFVELSGAWMFFERASRRVPGLKILRVPPYFSGYVAEQPGVLGTLIIGP
ncbi:MAG TPA: hypothetical protein VHZ07_11735 [Bryobacteraceae bacterium]|nr:hypothetical protein [Bryobacteraceae bacterium]